MKLKTPHIKKTVISSPPVIVKKTRCSPICLRLLPRELKWEGSPMSHAVDVPRFVRVTCQQPCPVSSRSDGWFLKHVNNIQTDILHFTVRFTVLSVIPTYGRGPGCYFRLSRRYMNCEYSKSLKRKRKQPSSNNGCSDAWTVTWVQKKELFCWRKVTGKFKLNLH